MALLRIRIEEKQRKLVRQDDVNELIDQIGCNAPPCPIDASA